MPEPDYDWLPRSDILDFAELERVVRAFASLGVDRVRLTGGEPLLRKDLPQLVRQLAGVDGIRDLAMTTNALLLGRFARELCDAGLSRVTVSLDTLDPKRYRELTQRDAFADAMRGIDAAVEVWPGRVKCNVVVMRGTNDDEIGPLIEFARQRRIEMRFIEYMDVGGATRWQHDQVVSRDQILRTIEQRFGSITARETDASAPARRFELGDGTTFGVIASTTAPFCRDCDRARLTADGTLLTCLYARLGVDVRRLLRAGCTDAELVDKLRTVWSVRVDRGAEQRLALTERGALAGADELRDDPHLEMHTRGG